MIFNNLKIIQFSNSPESIIDAHTTKNPPSSVTLRTIPDIINRRLGKNKRSSDKLFNQFGHKQFRHRLDMGDKRFSPSHIKLTNNNPNKDFKSVERP